MLPAEALADAIASRPEGALLQASHRYAHSAMARVLDRAREHQRRHRLLQDTIDRFATRHGEWLERAELFMALEHVHGDTDWRRWPERDRSLFAAGSAEQARARRANLRTASAEQIGAYRFGQLLAHEQHAAFRSEARSLGLRLSGDLQIGMSQRDLWAYRALLLPTVRMGAPPSRTNPEGQAWGYGVLDPDLYGTRGAPGAALGFVRDRARKLLEEFDGLRVDHPHGLIDPWVYAADAAEPARAVQEGARLFSSPERPEFERWAIALPGQVDSTEPPHGDFRLRELTEAQVEGYAILFDALVDATGGSSDSLIAEVLSTQPYPVRRVLERHGVGRFRVTQKAAMNDPADVYRAENARPQDWIMVGTHDTPPIWRVAERWVATGAAPERAAYLASRLVPDESDRPCWAQRVAGSAAALARAELANLFVGPAGNVMIFFPDLLGLREVYNRPGTMDPENWTLRVPPDFAVEHPRAARQGTALDLPAALATAIRARGPRFEVAHRALIEQLDAQRGPAPDAE